MPLELVEQTAIDERVVDNTDLEAALEKREKLKEQRGKATKVFNEADEQAKGMLAEFALEDGEVARCGRFRIAKKTTIARSVNFDVEPGSRLVISTIGDD
jgi:hypothetical protein